MRRARGEISKAIEIAEKYGDIAPAGAELTQRYEFLRQSLGEAPKTTSAPVTAARPPARDADAWQAAVTALNDKKYQQAADLFAAMWDKDRSHFDRLYLEGYALQLAGDPERGKSLMQKACMLPMGDPMARTQFAEQLAAAGLTDVAEQQRNLALQSGGEFDEVGFAVIYSTKADDAIDRKQWPAAIAALDRLCLLNLSTQVPWHDPVRLLNIPALTHLIKARDARDRHDIKTMMDELHLHELYLPMSSDRVLEFVPVLDDLGEHAKADELFNNVYEKQADICKKYPNSVSYRNEMAWMCACCDRKLDEGLAAAEAMVRLQPKDWQIMDTLAEVHFRKGDRARAVAIERTR